MATGSIGVTSLEAAAHEQVVKKLGELAESITSRFSCGGVLSSSSKTQLPFRKGSGEWAGVVFPGADEAAIQQLFSACSVANFGMGSKQVTDKSYRDAVKLEPDQFTTSFQLCDTPILGEIQMLMVPDVRTIQAELYKLNIYAPGGHFKAHVDTPRSEQRFGSLVVCLPTQFSGGALVTRHDGRVVQFDWSSSTQSPLQSVCWAAFFSDVEHEQLPRDTASLSLSTCTATPIRTFLEQSPQSTSRPVHSISNYNRLLAMLISCVVVECWVSVVTMLMCSRTLMKPRISHAY